jgi:hypothetical protein
MPWVVRFADMEHLAGSARFAPRTGSHHRPDVPIHRRTSLAAALRAGRLHDSHAGPRSGSGTRHRRADTGHARTDTSTTT